MEKTWQDAERLDCALAGEEQAAPGIYHLRDGQSCVIRGTKDRTVDLSGVTLVAGGTAPALVLRDCSGLVLRGLTLDCDPLPFSQGTVLRADVKTRRVLVQTDAGYRTPDGAWNGSRAIYWDAAGEKMLPNWYNDSIAGFQPLEDGRVWALHADGARPMATGLRPGCRVVFPLRAGGPALELNGCGGCTVQDLSIRASCGFGIGDFNGPGGNRYVNVTIAPPGGTGRLLSTAADGFHAFLLEKGPILEQVEISHTQDDLLNIHSFFDVYAGQMADGSHRFVTPFEADIVPGDRLRFYNGRSLMPKGSATVLRTALGQRGADGVRRQFFDAGLPLRDFPVGQAVTVWLDTPVDLAPLDLAASTGRDCRGAVLRGCHFHHGFVRGALLRASDSIVENCAFKHIQGQAIYANVERFWLEGHFVENLRMRANTYEDCCFGLEGGEHGPWDMVLNAQG